MKQKLSYQLYEMINEKNMTELFIKNIESEEKQNIEDIMVKFKYKNDISYLNLSKSNSIERYDDQGEFLDFEFEDIIDLDIADNKIEEIEISKYRIMIKTELYIIAFTNKIKTFVVGN